MNDETRSQIIEIFGGRRRVGPIATLVIALGVTALVAIPLTERVVRASEVSPAADSTSIMVDLVGQPPVQLDGATLSGHALISLNDPNAVGVSFALFEQGDQDPVLASQDLTGPNFFPRESPDGAGKPIDTALLDNGPYELFLTVTNSSGNQRTAVIFTVANP